MYKNRKKSKFFNFKKLVFVLGISLSLFFLKSVRQIENVNQATENYNFLKSLDSSFYGPFLKSRKGTKQKISPVSLDSDFKKQSSKNNLSQVAYTQNLRPSGFLENKGQILDTSLNFVLERKGLTFLLQKNGFTYGLNYIKSTDAGQKRIRNNIAVQLLDANPNPKISTAGKSKDKRHYLTASARAKNVHHYQEVVYHDIYPHIDLVFESYNPTAERFGIKYSFVLRPGADPKQIQLAYSGQEKLGISDGGIFSEFKTVFSSRKKLRIKTAGGEIGEEINEIFTVEKGGTKTPVEGSYNSKNGIVGFELGNYDKTKTLVIDPDIITVNLRQATYYGSEGTDRIRSVTADNKDTIYVAGVTSGKSALMSTDTYPYPYQNMPNMPMPLGAGNNDIIIAKFTPDLNKLVSATYYGGNQDDEALTIDLDDAGNIYVGGYTSSTDLPTEQTSVNYSSQGGQDMVVAKFTNNLSNLSWVVGFGGSGNERVNDFVVEGLNIFAVGTAGSSGLNTIGNTHSGGSDAFIFNIDSIDIDTARTLEWGRYYGGSGNDEGNGVAVYNNNVYATGVIINGRDDKAFIVNYGILGGLINSQNYGLYGITSNDIAIDQTGNFLAIVGTGGGTGFSQGFNSANLLNLTHQTTYGGGPSDGFLIKIRTSDLSVEWSSYYGGSANDVLQAVEIDCNNNITVAGYSRSGNNIAENGYINDTYRGGGSNASDPGDAIMAKFTSEGRRYYGTYFGNTGDEEGIGLGLSPNGNILLCGATTSGSGITFSFNGVSVYDSIYGANPPGQDANKEGIVGFISVFCDFIITDPPQSQTALLGNNVTFSIVPDLCRSTVTYQWSKDGNVLSDTTGNISGSQTTVLNLTAVTFSDAGEYCVRIQTDCGDTMLCDTLDIVELKGNNVCLDTASIAGTPSSNQETIKLIFSDLDSNNSITDAQYSWFVDPPSGATTILSGSVGPPPDSLPTGFVNDLYEIEVAPDQAGTYTFTLALQYEDSRRNPTTVNDTTSVTVEVYPFPNITNLSPNPDTICEGDMTNISIEADINLSRVDWQLIDNAGGNITGSTMGTIQGDAIMGNTTTFRQVFDLQNLVTMPQSGRVEFTPISAGGNCTGPKMSAQIIVKPRPDIMITNAPSTVCNNDTIGFNVNTSSAYVGTNFTWQRQNVTGIMPSASNGAFITSGSISETLQNTTDGALEVVYEITGTFDGCSTTENVTVSVLPSVDVMLSSSAVTICDDSTFSIDLSTNVTDQMSVGYKITSTNNPDVTGEMNVHIFGYDTGRIYTFQNTLNNSSANPQDIIYEIVPYQLIATGDTCFGSPENLTVTVQPHPYLMVSDTNVCDNLALNIIPSSSTVGANFSWEIININGANLSSGNMTGTGTISNTFSLNDPTAEGTVNYRVRSFFMGCPGDSQDIQVTVLPLPQVDLTASNMMTICGITPITLTATDITGATYTWFRDGTVVPGSANTIMVSQGGNYSVEVQTGEGCVNSNSLSVTQTDLVTIDPLTTTGSANTCSSDGVTLSINIRGGSANYQWQRQIGSDFANIDGSTGSSYIANTAGSYRVLVNPGTTCQQESNTIDVVFAPLPTAAINAAPDTVCPEESLDLTGTIMTNGATIQTMLWESTPSNLTIQNNGTLTPTLLFPENNTTAPIDYTIRFIAETNNGCSDTAEINISLQPLPQASFTIDTSICENTTLTATNISILSDTYTWQVLDSMGMRISGILNDSTAENPLLTFPANNSTNIIFYDVILEAKQGTCSDFDTVRANVFPQPILVISEDTSDSCTPKSLNLSSSMSDANDGQDFASLRWLVDGVEQSSSQMLNYPLENTSHVNRTFRITLIGETFVGCVDSTFINITVFPQPNATINAMSLENCSPFTINATVITLEPRINSTYLWEVLREGTVIATSNIITPPTYMIDESNDSVTYRLSVTNACGTDRDSVIFRTIPDPIPAFTRSDSTICHNESITFTNMTTLTDGMDLPSDATVEWDFGDGATSTDRSPSHIFTNSSNMIDITYTVTLTVTYKGCTKNTSKIVTVHPEPLASFSIDPACAGDTIFINNMSIGKGNLSYLWSASPASGIAIYDDTSENPRIVVSEMRDTNFSYSISLEVTSEDSCVNSITEQLVIFGQPTATFTMDTSICSADIMAVSNGSTFADAYTWQVLDSMGSPVTGILNDSTAENPLLTFPANNSTNIIFYDVILEAKQGTCSDFDTVRANVFPQPILVISEDTSDSCTPKSLNLSSLMSNSNDGEALNVEWFVDGISQGMDSTFNDMLYNTSTSDRIYRVTLVGETSQGCIDSTSVMITVYPNPKAEFTASQTVSCAPFTLDSNLINLVDYPDANSNYLWQVIDSSGMVIDSSNTMLPPTHIIMDPFDSVILRLISFSASAKGCGNDTFNVVFRTLPDPIPDFTRSDSAICHNESITFTNMTTLTDGMDLPSDATVEWDFGDGATSTDRSPSHIFTNSSNMIDITYTVTLFVDYQGCVDSVSKDVTIYPAPRVDFQISNVCGGDSVQVVNNSFGKGNLHYFWSATPSTSITFNNDTLEEPTISIMTSSNSDLTFDITLIVESEDSCTSSLTQELLVFGDPTASIQGDSILCKNIETRFQSLAPSVSSDLAPDAFYIWNFGDGNQDTIDAPERVVDHTYLDTGVYNVMLTVINTAGCVNIDSFRVCVIDVPDADFTKTLISFENDSFTVRDSVQGKSNDEICGPIVGLKVSDLSFTYDKAGVNTSYLWDFGNGQTSTLKSPPTIYYEQDDHASITYLITLTLDDGFCGSHSIQDTITIFPSPKARLNFELQQACDEIPISIFNNSVGLPTQYIYDFGDGSPMFTTNDSRTIDHIFPGTAGKDTTYTVTLIAQNTCGSDTIRQSIRVIPNDMSADISIESPDGFFCKNQNITFIANGFLDSTAQLTWHFGNGNVFTQEDTVIYSYPQAGTYQVILEIFIPVCNDTDLDTIEIVIQDSPDIDFSMPASICFNSPLNIENTGNIQSVNTVWNMGDGTEYTNVTPSLHTYSAPGNYTVTMRLIGANGCLSTVSKIVEMRPLPLANFEINSSPICNAESITMTNTSSGAASYLWRIPSLNDERTNENPAFIFEEPGLYEIMLYVFDLPNLTGCIDSISKVISVLPRPLAKFSIPEKICLGEILYPQDSSLSAFSHFWDFGDGGIDSLSGETTDHLYSLPGIYDVTLTVTAANGCTDIFVQAVEVIRLPEPVCRIIQKPLCLGTQISFENLTEFPDTTDSAAHFIWKHNGVIIDTMPNPESVIIEQFMDSSRSDTFTLCIIYRGCLVSESYIVETPQYLGCIFEVPSHFSPNRDGFNDEFWVEIAPNDMANITEVRIQITTLQNHGILNFQIKRNAPSESMKCMFGCADYDESVPWEQQIFWNGHLFNDKKLNKLEPGLYQYLVEVICCTGSNRSKKGYIQLIVKE